jgi:hypothetical protein
VIDTQRARTAGLRVWLRLYKNFILSVERNQKAARLPDLYCYLLQASPNFEAIAHQPAVNMAVRIFSGIDPDYELGIEPKEPYSWSVGRLFIAKRKRDGKVRGSPA